MELLKLVQEGSFENIKELLELNSIPANNKWTDYTALTLVLENKRKDVAKLFLEKNFRVNKTGKSVSQTNTPLHYAVKLEDLELLNHLLKRKASITAINEEEDTPLHMAFMNRNNFAVDAMLATIKNSKVVNPKNRRGLSHFHIACTRNNETVVGYFLKSGIDITSDTINADSLLWSGYTALHFAVEFQSLNVVKQLLSCNSELGDISDLKEQRPFDIAKKNFENASVINYCLGDNRYLIDSKISDFHIACMRDDTELILNFLKNGAAVNIPVSKNSKFCPGYLPLHFAVESNKKENVQLLLKYGAKMHKNGYYMTPLHLALYSEDHKEKNTIVDLLYSKVEKKDDECSDLNGLTYFHIACTRNDIPTLNKYLNRGEDVNAQILWNLKDFSHYTPLHLTARYNSLEATELLIKHGADVNRNDYGLHGTPLHIAFDNANYKVAELLLANGAKANCIRPYDDKTMLHIFVEEMINRSWRDPETVIKNIMKNEKDCDNYTPRLIKLGCSVNAQDSDGNTALHIACSNLTLGDRIAEILLKNGADINLENNEGDTAFDCAFSDIYRNNADSYMMFYDHVQKLKDLGFKVNPKNEKCCEKLLKEKDECDPDASCFMEENINDKHKRRMEEIEKMKKVKLDKRTSLYQILLEDVKKLSLICKNTSIKDIIEAKDFKKSYPFYGDMLEFQYQKGLSNLGTQTFEKLMSLEEAAAPRAKRRRR